MPEYVIKYRTSESPMYPHPMRYSLATRSSGHTPSFKIRSSLAAGLHQHRINGRNALYFNPRSLSLSQYVHHPSPPPSPSHASCQHVVPMGNLYNVNPMVAGGTFAVATTMAPPRGTCRTYSSSVMMPVHTNFITQSQTVSVPMPYPPNSNWLYTLVVVFSPPPPFLLII